MTRPARMSMTSVPWSLYRTPQPAVRPNHHDPCGTCCYIKSILVSTPIDRKSTRLNSSHLVISYAVFCLKKKTRINRPLPPQRPDGAPPRHVTPASPPPGPLIGPHRHRHALRRTVPRPPTAPGCAPRVAR